MRKGISSPSDDQSKKPKEKVQPSMDRRKQEEKRGGGAKAEDSQLVPGLARRPKPRSETRITASYPETYITVGNVGRALETSIPRSQPERACPRYILERQSVGKVPSEPQQSGAGSSSERPGSTTGLRGRRGEEGHDPDRSRPYRSRSEPPTSGSAQQAVQIVKLEAESDARSSGEVTRSTSGLRSKNSGEGREPDGQRPYRPRSEPPQFDSAQTVVQIAKLDAESQSMDKTDSSSGLRSMDQKQNKKRGVSRKRAGDIQV